MKKGHIAVLVLIAACVAVIISTVGDASSYETFESAAEKPDTKITVVGNLIKDEPYYYNPEEDPNYFRFAMFDKDSVKATVVFKGAKPQDFERSEQLVLTGAMVADTFRASKILMKCPSKYQDGRPDFENDQMEVTEVTEVTEANVSP